MKETQIPADLRKALGKSAKAKEKWDSLTPIGRHDFVTWIESAKQDKTRIKRIEKACDMLISGKRRPCCYSIVPLELYSALNAAPKAKAVWKSLSPTEKRVYLSWVESAEGKGEHAKRIDKACALLKAGNRHP
jgi:uncharacterized protein YdeI (YjbR/CyaY-like superfamily)